MNEFEKVVDKWQKLGMDRGKAIFKALEEVSNEEAAKPKETNPFQGYDMPDVFKDLFGGFKR